MQRRGRLVLFTHSRLIHSFMRVNDKSIKYRDEEDLLTHSFIKNS
jgi:hypothetical protein